MIHAVNDKAYNLYMKPIPTIDEIKALHQAGQLQAAKEGYLKILAEQPQAPEALHLLGLVFAEEGDLTTATSYLQQAQALDQADVSISLHLANIYKAQAAYQQAEELLKSMIAANPSLSAAYNNLGTVYFKMERWQEAIKAFEKAIQIQPDYLDAYYNLGLAFNKTTQKREAMNAFQAILDLSPEHPGANFQLALGLMAKQQYQQALPYLLRMAEKFPYHFETQVNLGTIYLHFAELDKARTHYLKAVEIQPNDEQVLFNLGVISMQLQDPASAITYYERAGELDPQNFAVQNNLGFIHLMLKHHTEAIRHFEAALSIAPNNESIRHTLRILKQDNSIADSPPEYVEALFDSYADHFDKHLLQQLHYQGPLLLKKALADWQVLDLGCGTGLCGEIMRPFAKTLIGVDLSEKMLALAAQKNIYDELVHAAILPYLHKQHHQFQLVTSADTFVYTGDLAPVFAAVHQALSEKGLLVFNTEISDDADFKLTSSGRFAHSQRYLERAIAEQNFSIAFYQRAVIRTQAGQPVWAHVYVLRKE
jgi:predicted TPR repeat methyltransferase